VIPAGNGAVDLETLLAHLYDMGVRRLMVEGGGRLIGSFFEKGIVDEFITFIGNIVIGGEEAPTPSDGRGFVKEQYFPSLTLYSVERMDHGVLLHWMVRKNEPG